MPYRTAPNVYKPEINWIQKISCKLFGLHEYKVKIIDKLNKKKKNWKS